MRKFLILFSISVYLQLTVISGQVINNSTQTKIQIVTDSGTITVVLYNNTPLHKENFIKLINEGYFDGQIFHRLIKGFMIQAGDPNSKNAEKGELLGQGGPGYTIPAEINPENFHKKGALAAARRGDDVNPLKESSGSQFYIVQGNRFTKSQLDLMVEKKMHGIFTNEQIEKYTSLGGSPHLDGNYTVFGEVTNGLDILDRLMNSPVDSYDRPVYDIKFKIKLLE